MKTTYYLWKKRRTGLLKYRPRERCYLKATLGAVKLLTPLYKPILPSTRALTAMESVKSKL